MNISFDFEKSAGKIRAMHVVGQPPRIGISDKYMHYLTDAHMPYSRLHDVGYPYGSGVYVDVPNIFRNFDADENDPASYDFAFTDLLLQQLHDAKCEPYFRLGVTIENFPHVKAYRIFPPKDPAKWARICEHIVRHYNEDWADGYCFGITYWEIWNEPDNDCPELGSMMWRGTFEEYYALYEVAAKHLKACFGDSIKVGGPATCGFYDVVANPQKYGMDFPAGEALVPRTEAFMQFIDGFFDHIAKTDAPIDFFSWHSYESVENTVKMQKYVDKMLAERGLSHIETHINEWNNVDPNKIEKRGSSEASAKAAAMMLAMQFESVDILCYYDAQIGESVYGGLFHPMTYKPLCTYYPFVAFGEMYAMGNMATGGIAEEGIYAVGAFDKTHKGVLIANIGASTQEITADLPQELSAYRIDEQHHMIHVDIDPAHFAIDSYTVYYFTDKVPDILK